MIWFNPLTYVLIIIIYPIACVLAVKIHKYKAKIQTMKELEQRKKLDMELYGAQDIDMVIFDVNDYEQTDGDFGYVSYFDLEVNNNEKDDYGVKNIKPRGIGFECVMDQMEGKNESVAQAGSHFQNNDTKEDEEE